MTSDLVVGVGQCSVEYLGLVPKLCEGAGVAEIAQFSQQGAGSAANTLCTLACFGVSTRLVSKVSDDPFGTYILSGLEGLGVDTAQVSIGQGRVTPFAFRAVEMKTGARANYFTHGNLEPLTSGEVDEVAALDGATSLLVDGSMVEPQLKAAELARSRGIPVVISGGPIREGIGDLLALADILVASEGFATEIAAAPELDQSLRELNRLGPKTCVITLGGDGAIGSTATDPTHSEPAQEVDVLDPAGAGDVYAGALIYAILQQWPLVRSMRFASAAAALSCRILGARAGIPELSEVLAVAEAIKE